MEVPSTRVLKFRCFSGSECYGNLTRLTLGGKKRWKDTQANDVKDEDASHHRNGSSKGQGNTECDWKSGSESYWALAK